MTYRTTTMRQHMAGFTMIELIVVIVILGILAAVALPRFTNIQGDARIAKLNAARGTVGAAATLVHGTFLARGGVADTAACPGGGGTANNTTTLCTENGTVNIVNGYPSANVAGIVNASGVVSVWNPTAAQLAADGYATTGGGAALGSTLTVQVNGGSAPANCSFTYRPSNGAANSAAVISAVTTTGCR